LQCYGYKLGFYYRIQKKLGLEVLYAAHSFCGTGLMYYSKLSIAMLLVSTLVKWKWESEYDLLNST